MKYIVSLSCERLSKFDASGVAGVFVGQNLNEAGQILATFAQVLRPVRLSGPFFKTARSFLHF